LKYFRMRSRADEESTLIADRNMGAPRNIMPDEYNSLTVDFLVKPDDMN